MEQLQGTIDAKIHDAPLKLLTGSRRAVREGNPLAPSSTKRKKSSTDDVSHLFTSLAQGEQVACGNPLEGTVQKKEEVSKKESYPAGTYVRLQLADVPATFVENFNPSRIHIVGGVLPEEQANGFIRVSPRSRMGRPPIAITALVDGSGPSQEAPLVRAHPEVARPSHHLLWLAALPIDGDLRHAGR